MIIGLVGRKGSGKDEAARGLCYPPTDSVLEDPKRMETWRTVTVLWRRVAFADQLKQAAHVIFDLTDEQLHGSQEEKEAIDPRWGLSARAILQRLGTEVGRHIHPDVWIKSAGFAIARQQAKRYHVVITDVRFQNEAHAIDEWGGILGGGILVRIERPTDAPAPGGTWPAQADMHPSEVEQGEIACDHTIVNDSTVAALHAAIWTIALNELARGPVRPMRSA